MPTRVLLAALLAAAQKAAASDTFSFDMGDLRLRVIVPDIPQMRMEAQGNERFSGANGAYTMSLLLPKAEAGTTPRDCAGSIARTVINRFGLDPKYVVTGQANETTFLMMFPYRLDPVIQFKAFLLSGYKGTHCVEVHISRTVLPAPEKALAEDLARWFQGFRGAKIETY
jgi:hypothetical protein